MSTEQVEDKRKRAEELSQQAYQETPEQPETQTAEPPQAEALPVDWEQRYKDYRAGIDPKLHEARVLMQQKDKAIEEARMVAAAQFQERQRLESEMKKPEEVSLTEEQREFLGEEGAQAVEQIADGKTQQIREELAELKQRQEQEHQQRLYNEQRNHQAYAEQQRRQAMVSGTLTRVEQLVPEARKINDDPRFIQWAKDRDPQTGKSRESLAYQAMLSGDHVRVASIFAEWVGTGGQMPNRHVPAPQGAVPSTSRQPQQTYQAGEYRDFVRKKRDNPVWARSEEAKAQESEWHRRIANRQVK